MILKSRSISHKTHPGHADSPGRPKCLSLPYAGVSWPLLLSLCPIVMCQEDFKLDFPSRVRVSKWWWLSMRSSLSSWPPFPGFPYALLLLTGPFLGCQTLFKTCPKCFPPGETFPPNLLFPPINIPSITLCCGNERLFGTPGHSSRSVKTLLPSALWAKRVMGQADLHGSPALLSILVQRGSNFPSWDITQHFKEWVICF